MQALNVVCLGLILGCALLGIFSEQFRDNWAQFWGLVGMVFWSSARLAEVMQGASVMPLQVLGHVSLSLLSVGTAYHVWQGWRRSHPSMHHVGPT